MSSAPRSAAATISAREPASGCSGERRRATRIGEAEDDAEEIVEVVGDPPGEDADCFHLLRLPELLLEAPPRRRVLHDVDAADGAPLVVAEEADRRLDDDALARLRDVGHLAPPVPRGAQGIGVGDEVAGAPLGAEKLGAVAADRFARGVPIEPLGGLVPVRDPRGRVRGDHRFVHPREERRLEAEALLGFALLGDVVPVAHDCADGRLVEEVRGRPLEPAPRAVLVANARRDLDARARRRAMRGQRCRRVVRVEEITRQLADELVGGVAEDPFEARARVDEALVLVDEDDGVVAVLDEGAEAALARLEAHGVARRRRCDLANRREDRRAVAEGHARRHDFDLEDLAALPLVVPAANGSVDARPARAESGDVRHEARGLVRRTQLARVHREELLARVAVRGGHLVVDGEDLEGDLVEHPRRGRPLLEECSVGVVHAPHANMRAKRHGLGYVRAHAPPPVRDRTPARLCRRRRNVVRRAPCAGDTGSDLRDDLRIRRAGSDDRGARRRSDERRDPHARGGFARPARLHGHGVGGVPAAVSRGDARASLVPLRPGARELRLGAHGRSALRDGRVGRRDGVRPRDLGRARPHEGARCARTGDG